MQEDPDSKELLLGTTFAVITKIYFGSLDKRLKEVEIDRYHSLILYLELSTARQTQQVLADRFRKDKTSMVRIIDYLSDKGFIRRAPNEDDRREHIIELTEKGRNAFSEIRRAIQEVNDTAFRNLEPRQRKLFTEILTLVEQNMSEEPSIDFQMKYRNKESE